MSKKSRASKTKVARATRRTLNTTAKNKARKLERHLRAFPQDVQAAKALAKITSWKTNAGRKSGGGSVESRIAALQASITELSQMLGGLRKSKGKNENTLQEAEAKLLSQKNELSALLGVRIAKQLETLPREAREKNGKINGEKVRLFLAKSKGAK